MARSSSLKHGLVGDRILVDADRELYFQPMFDRILVLPKETRAITDGGIVIPDTAKIEETMGSVVSVGHGHFDEHGNFVDDPNPFTVGDIVVFKEFTGVHITLNDTRYLIIWNRDVLGVLYKVKEV